MDKRLTNSVVIALMTFREIFANYGYEVFANYGYEEGMKRILAKQIQQTLKREQQSNLAPVVAQSFSQ